MTGARDGMLGSLLEAQDIAAETGVSWEDAFFSQRNAAALRCAIREAIAERVLLDFSEMH